ncbi:Uncharacterised protein [[Eubacterium] siraeum]|uniref:Uncharacterized protein n=1 Tax=[Eubacterium] siraeum TaxID=39492 RepID=A0A174ZAQ9_9FIRM|nr:Uncharacterised protein [[Eubacterium] siraeum]
MVGKVCFFKKVLVLNPYPQTPFPRKGAILLGLPPLVPVGGFAPATPFLSTIEVFRQTGTSLLCGRLAKKLLILFLLADDECNNTDCN